MGEIKITRPSKEELEKLGTANWSPWSCPVSTFDWEYDMEETAYVFEGRVEVETPSGKVDISGGDLVTFPKGLKCKWKVLEPIRKVYVFK